jgi:vacuolar-type H+-ATPase subunit H
MPGKRKTTDHLAQPTTRGKLVRLLQTEGELDEMLRDVRRSAEDVVAAARAAGEQRLQQCERELENIARSVRERVERERDETIAGIRSEAQNQTQALNGLDEEAVTELANYVIERVLGGLTGVEP